MEKVLFIVGASIFGVLGTIHLIYTFFTNKFDTIDLSVKKAMQNTSPILTKETTVWKAWIGFNASHSFGAMLFAGIYIPLAIFYFEVIQQSFWFSFLPVVVGLSYLILAKKYWFRIPFTAVLISTVCFVGGAILLNT